MTNLNQLSLTELATLIRGKQVSSVEVAESFIAQIESRNPTLNAMVTLNHRLLDQARAADAQLANGEALGVLHGVPISVKDTIETAGLRTTSGSLIRADYVPETDAPAVELLKNAGALILGKTNAAEMAMDYNADNPVFGRTYHPLDSRLTPGGSSGGEAVAIATHMSPAGIGSDLAGSIRIPAHFCGISGLKPGTNVIPREGQYPPSIGPYSLGAAIGPLARHVADLELMFRALVPTTSRDSSSTPSEIRIACYAFDGAIPVTDATEKALNRAAQILSDRGLDCRHELPPNLERANELWLKLFSRTSVVQLRKVYAGREEDGGTFVSWRLKNADNPPPPTLDEYISNWMERDLAREELLRWMDKTPVILAPVGATPAFLHDTLRLRVRDVDIGTFRAFGYAQAFNVFDLPVVTVPVGKSEEGLPIGVQVVGRPNEELTALRVAAMLEHELSQ
ncbi:MAG TPA: amidase [Pyrinomonadaceae bacterium]|nr:amidase [Pyrinomonadaceae bacterium]